jgi:hypothetical protein
MFCDTNDHNRICTYISRKYQTNKKTDLRPYFDISDAESLIGEIRHNVDLFIESKSVTIINYNLLKQKITNALKNYNEQIISLNDELTLRNEFQNKCMSYKDGQNLRCPIDHDHCLRGKLLENILPILVNAVEILKGFLEQISQKPIPMSQFAKKDEELLKCNEELEQAYRLQRDMARNHNSPARNAPAPDADLQSFISRLNHKSPYLIEYLSFVGKGDNPDDLYDTLQNIDNNRVATMISYLNENKESFEDKERAKNHAKNRDAMFVDGKSSINGSFVLGKKKQSSFKFVSHSDIPQNCVRYSISVKTLAGKMHYLCTDNENDNILRVKNALRPNINPMPSAQRMVLTEMLDDGSFKIWADHEPITKNLVLNLVIHDREPDGWDRLIENST